MKNTAISEFGELCCPVAAFELAKTLAGGVLKREVVTALDRFYRLPCPETAVVLASVFPEVVPVLRQTTDFALRLGSEGHRGAWLVGIDEYVEEAQSRLGACDAVHEFVAVHSRTGAVRIGFHRLRDQKDLLARIALLGEVPSAAADRRQWLRDVIATKLAAWRVVADLVCLHGVLEGVERFWNSMGAEESAQWYLHAEVLFDLGPVALDFLALVSIKLGKRQVRSPS